MNAIINSESVLTMAKQLLRLSATSDNDVFLDSLILQGTRRLTTNETLIIKDCTVTTNNSRFYLPKDCKQLIAFRLSNSCIPGVFVDFPFFTQCGCSATSLGMFGSFPGMLDIKGRWAYFKQSVADDTDVEIAYEAVYTDENGLPVINEEAELALSQYAAWQFAVAYPELYNRFQAAEWKEGYMLQAGKVRSLAARRRFEQDKNQISQKINQMINTSVPFSYLSGYYNAFYFPTFTSI